MKITQILVALMLFVSFATLAKAQAQDDSQRLQYVFDSDSKLTIDGTSSLHDWKCDIEKFDGAFTIDPKSTPKEMYIATGRLIVKIDDIECGNGTMNKKLREALSENKAKNVTFTINSTTATQKPLDLMGMGLKGSLTIVGTTKPVEIETTARYGEDNSVQLEGSFSLLMKEYGVDPPTALLGTIRTGDKVTIRFLVTAHPATNL